MTECMQYCQKMQQSRAPVIRNPDEMQAFLKRFAEIVYTPGTSSPFPTALGSIVWSPFTDEEEEGKWEDWYTREKIDLIDKVFGQIGMLYALP